jgi:pimeloyl-ACP methyl ester carboxylesterase
LGSRSLSLLAGCLVAAGVIGTSAPGAGAARALPAASAAQHDSDDCKQYGVQCLRVSVPLDWSGARPGRISLSVEIARVKSHPRGVMFLLAGGPGQASTSAFYIGRGGSWQRRLPGYTLVTFDPRGTGDSSPLRCDATFTTAAQYSGALADCASQLGPARDYYRTSDNARDIDAVRRALGFRTIGLFGVSYGTEVALAYAQLFPTRVSRLLLDSVFHPLTTADSVSASLKRVPAALDAYCRGVCGGVTAHYGADAVALANQLAARPLRGMVQELDGGRRRVELGSTRFLSLLLTSDLTAGLAAELPAAVRAALDGDPQPLLRLADLALPVNETNRVPPVYTATTCDDALGPWKPDTPISDRKALLKEQAAALPAGWTGRFGPWATAFAETRGCLTWPASDRPAETLDGPYPDVPVLAIGGVYDMRAPRVEALDALKQFKHGHFLAVLNGGHSALTAASSTCADSAVRAWLDGRHVPSTCRGIRSLLPLTAFPPAVLRHETPAQTLSLIVKTLHEAEATWFLDDEFRVGKGVPGLNGGRLESTGSGFTLSGYRISTGLALTGELGAGYADHARLSVGGVVKVADGSGTIGTLAVNGDALDGTLDGRLVVAGRLSGPVRPAVPVLPGSRWSTWQPPPGSTSGVTKSIARYVAPRYHLDAGTQLVDVTSMPPATPEPQDRRPVAALGVPKTRRFDASHLYRLTEGTWSYLLCGRGPGCSIPGEPSITRGRLVGREALELALYTFEFAPRVTSVIVYLPAVRGIGHTHTLIYLERSRFTHELSVPLVRTLPLADPPAATAPDAREAGTIERLAQRNAFTFATRRFQDGRALLWLYPYG